MACFLVSEYPSPTAGERFRSPGDTLCFLPLDIWTLRGLRTEEAIRTPTGIQTPLPPTVQATSELGLEVGHLAHVLLGTGVLGLPLALGAARWDGNLGRVGLAPGAGARRGADELAEAEDLIQDHLAHLADVLDHLEVEVECGRAVGLVRGVVPDLEVGVLKGLLDRGARGRVEGEHAIEQVEGVRVGVGEERAERLLGHEGQVAHVLLGPGRADARQRLLVGRAEDVQDLVQLVDVVAALEEGPPAQELGEDAAY